jgi:sulfide:quinone oxidoreductase
MGRKIVILGGGIGGVLVANYLRKSLNADHQIILIDKSDKHYYQPAFLGVMTGRLTPQATQKKLNSIERKGVKFLNQSVIGIDPDNKKVETESGSVSYDYLIIALGADFAAEKIPGLIEAGFTPYRLESVENLRDEISKFQSGRIAVLVSSLPYKCPAVPYETAFLLDSFYKKKGRRKNISITIFTPEGLPMPSAGPAHGNAIKNLLKKRGIGFYPLLTPVAVENREIVFADGRREGFDLLIYVPPHKVPDVIKNSALAGENGWISVDPANLKTKFENVYAIGDVTAIKLPGSYKPDTPLFLPKAGVFAHEEAKVAAKNIAMEIKGKKPERKYSGEGMCFLETGEGKAGFAKGDFYATPAPKVYFKMPGNFWRFTKILFEKYWLWARP